METPVLELNAITMKAEQSEMGGIDSLSLSIMPGEVVALLGGHTGERKILIDLLCGLEEPDHGSVQFKGIDLGGISEMKRHRLRGRMGVVTDPPVFLNNVRMMENLRLPSRYHTNRDRKSIDTILFDLCRKVGLEDFPDVIPTHFDPEFLGAAALVRALSIAPDLLIIDRPLESLGRELSNRLPRIWDETVIAHGGSVFLLTTVPEFARRLADRVAVFEEGSIARVEASPDSRVPPGEKA